MRIVIVSFAMMLALLFNSANADEEMSLSPVVKMFEERDAVGIHNLRFNPQVIKEFSLEDRNKVALVAAQSLSIKKYIDVIGENDIREYFTKPSAEDSPEEAECRKQLGINWSAASLLSHLAQKRMINEPKVLPYLIEALNHPDKHSVGHPSFNALRALTGRGYGNAYWIKLAEDKKRHTEIVLWWQNWLERNRDRHPVFDLTTEQAAETAILEISRSIEAVLKKKYAELEFFNTPEELPRHWQRWYTTVLYIEYNPRLFSFPIHNVQRDKLPWILIICSFESQEIENKPPPELRELVTTCYSKELEGTSLTVQVLVASSLKTLAQDIKLLLEGNEFEQ